MSDQQIVLRDDGLAKLTLKAPEEVIKQASKAAEVLMQIVEERGLAKALGGKKKHLEYEAWSTVATFYNCTIRCPEDSVHPIGEIDNGRYAGFKAHADIVNQNGDVIGGADAYCMRDEENWVKKPNFQLASMAQTRAGSKAARMIFSWVAVLAGFSPTPAEEVVPEYGGHSVEEDLGLEPVSGDATAKPPATHTTKKSGVKITEKQAGLLYGKLKTRGLDTKGMAEFLKPYGYEKTFDVDKSDFDRILAELE